MPALARPSADFLDAIHADVWHAYALSSAPLPVLATGDSALDAQLRRIEAENAALRARVAELERAGAATGMVVRMTAATASVPTVSSKPPAGRTVTVRSGDTLRKIADRSYGDPNLWTIIYEANRATMRNSGDLEVGQALIVPRRR